ncbi:MAG: PAS domain S-box protein [Thermodesulfobacteriota bacterium]|nr:PAS domain S-box protein [Thermodesulfobacteriota bacterium]
MSEKPTYEELAQRVRELEQAEARRKAEAETGNNASGLLSFFIKHSPIYAFLKEVSHTDSRVLFASDNYINIIGLPSSQMVGKTMADLFPPEFAEKMTRDDIDVVRKGIHLKLNEEFNGRHYVTYKFPINQDEKTYLAGYTIDITDLKQTEEDLTQIFNMSLDMICIADIHTATFLKVNPAFTETLGFNEAELLEKPFFDFIHPEDVEATRAIVDQKLQKGARVINFDNRYRCKDGTYRWLSWVSHPSPEQGVTYAVARDITGWKQKEEALEKSNAFLEATGRMARVGGWELDAETLEVTWTAETYRIHEIPLDQKPSLEGALDFYPPDERGKLAQAIQRALDHGEPYDMEIRFITAKGNHLWTRTICQPEVIDGRTVKLRGTFQDITLRKHAQEALREKDAMLTNIASQVPGMLYQFRMAPDGTYSVPYSSNGVKEIFGCMPEDVRDDFSLIFNTFHPEDRERIQQTIDESARHMSQWVCEYRVQVPGKPLKWIYGNSIPEQKADGSIVWSGYNMDITERKQAEALLRDSEEQFRHFFEHLTIGVAVYEAVEDGNDFVFSDMNPAGQQLSRVSIDDIRGKRLTEIFPGVRDLGLFKALQGTWQTGQPGHVPLNKYTDNRITQWVENRVFQIPSGKVVAVFDDRTEIVRLEEGLRQAQKMESIGTLAGGIAHDFNNILASIIGFTELAMDDAEKGTPLADNLAEIDIAGKRARDLVKQILTISRHDEKRIQPFQLTSVIKEALKMLRATIPASIEFREGITGDPLVIEADPIQTHQVLINLITNAKQAMADGPGVLEISVKSVDFGADITNTYPDVKPGKYARIVVSDTGTGISEENLDKIFEPYFTTKEKGTGTGLGLSVVHGIVKSAGGYITVNSEPGKGTTFHVYLPLAQKAAIRKTENDVEQIPHGKERVLLVDDEAAIVKIQQTRLEKLGYHVTPKTSSLEALEIFRSSPDTFDLVITDMAMPKMTGDKLAMAVKSIRPEVPVILCTGFNEKVNNQRNNGYIDELMMKPIGKVEMAKRVRKVLDKVKTKHCDKPDFMK